MSAIGLLLTAGMDQSTAEVISGTITESIDEISSMSPGQMASGFIGFFKEKLPDIVTALIFFVVGYILIKLVTRFMRRMLRRSKANSTLDSFIVSTIRVILYIILIITCIGILGVNFTPMIAALGALGLAFSLAVKDTLGNLAGGLSLLFSRPFSVDDYVEIGGQPGTIREIGMVYTILQTVDNKKTYLPNGDVAKAVIINYTAEPIRRLDLTFSIPEDRDYELVRAAVLETIDRNPLALKEPGPVARFSDHSISFVKLTIFVWSENANLLELKSQLISEIRTQLRES